MAKTLSVLSKTREGSVRQHRFSSPCACLIFFKHFRKIHMYLRSRDTENIYFLCFKIQVFVKVPNKLSNVSC